MAYNRRASNASIRNLAAIIAFLVALLTYVDIRSIQP
jgi:hypothetical protein